MECSSDAFVDSRRNWFASSGESLKAESKGREWEPKVETKFWQSINGIKHAYIGMKFETHVEYCSF